MLSRKQIIRNIIIFGIGFVTLYLADLLSKKYLFDIGVPAKDYGWIGIRSVTNDSTTIFSFLQFHIPIWAHNLIGFSILALITFPIFFTKDKFSVIALTIMSAGIAGNVFDRAYLSFVRDIIYTPWHDKGTFNIADITVITGAGLFAIAQIIKIFRK